MSKGWERIEMGHLCSIESGESDTVDAVEDGAYAFFDRSKKVKRSSRYLYDCEALIVPGEGKEFFPRHYNGKFDLHQRAYALFDFSPKIEPRFLFHYLHHFSHYLPSVAVGATVKSLRRRHFLHLPVAVTSLPEQKRIVGVLDEAFAELATAQANAEKNLQNARALFESHLQSIFASRGKDWLEKRLGDIVTRLTNGYVGPTRNIYLESGVPYLLARHVKNNVLTFDSKTFISEAFNQKNKKSILKAGDVLLVQSGHIGHSAVVSPEHDGHNCHAMIVITPIPSVVTGEFLSLYFNSSEMRQRFDKIRSGSTVPHLTCGAVKEMLMPLPDLATQSRLVHHSKELQLETQRLARIYEQKQAALAELKKSLLHQAFSGNL